MAIFRGPRRSIPTKPGEERVTFLREVASTLGCDLSQLDPSASMTKRYGVDELEIFEYMAAAKNNGLDNAEPRTPENTTPTSFRQWCEEVLKPAVVR